MVYLVLKGETWACIAARYYTTEAHLRQLNRWPDGELRAGVRIVVEGYLSHLVLPCEDAERIAATYGVQADAIRRANPDGIHPLCRIKVPV